MKPPENIATIMQAAPPAENLEGLKLEYRLPKEGENTWFYTNKPNEGCAWGAAGKHWQTLFLVRVPIVEWIENDDITDEMVVKAGGRVPCEVRDREECEWVSETLLMVEEEMTCRFITVNTNRIKCRIKKSDLTGKMI